MKHLKAATVFFGITFILVMLLSIQLSKRSTDAVINQARILLKDDLSELQNGNYDNVQHEYLAFGLDGVIIASYTDGYAVGQKVNVTKELQTDHAFIMKNSRKIKITFPLTSHDVVERFAVFLVDKNEMYADEMKQMAIRYVPMLLWGFTVIGFLVWFIIKMNRNVYKPIHQMSESAAAIIEGNYQKEIVQYDVRATRENEMEHLIYSFEMMRDELSAKAVREEKLKNSQKELLSCMSHDLRTPIATIKAHAEAIRDGIVVTEDKKNEYLNTMIRKTDTLNRMIADLLDHSNAELNQLTIRKEEVYLKKYLDDLAPELSTYCNKCDCSFRYENQIPELLVNMDGNRITQVIYNLIENACKYMGQKSETAAEENKVGLLCVLAEEEKRVYFHVTDNGPGIAMADIPFVFERFYRAEKSRSMQIPGAGLGLSICRYIIEAHGGEIEVKSKSNRGTEVVFFLNY